jgi:esterase/lipase
MSVLPVVWKNDGIKSEIYSEINNEDGTYKLIDINDYNEEELKSAKENTKKNVDHFKELLSQYKELVNEIKDPNYKSVNYDDHILDDVIDFNSIEQYNNYNTKIDELIHSIQGNINDINDAIETKVEQKSNDNEIYEPDYTIQD